MPAVPRPQAAGFVVLVTGTLVYGRGDEEGVRQEMAEAAAVAAAQEPMGTEAATYTPGTHSKAFVCCLLCVLPWTHGRQLHRNSRVLGAHCRAARLPCICIVAHVAAP